jgi:hypothetical protein
MAEALATETLNWLVVWSGFFNFYLSIVKVVNFKDIFVVDIQINEKERERLFRGSM